jgi:hypothetical protein
MPGTFSQIYIQIVFAVQGGKISSDPLLKKKFIDTSPA